MYLLLIYKRLKVGINSERYWMFVFLLVIMQYIFRKTIPASRFYKIQLFPVLGG